MHVAGIFRNHPISLSLSSHSHSLSVCLSPSLSKKQQTHPFQQRQSSLQSTLWATKRKAVPVSKPEKQNGIVHCLPSIPNTAFGSEWNRVELLLLPLLLLPPPLLLLLTMMTIVVMIGIVMMKIMEMRMTLTMMVVTAKTTIIIINNNNRIQRRYSRFFTISSQRRELSPTRTLKWPGRNRVQITCNTSSAYHVQVSCYVPLGTKGQLSY